MLYTTSQDFRQNQSRKPSKILWIWQKKKKKWGDGVEWFQDMDLGEIQELSDTTPEELIEPDLMEMNALKPGPDTEEQDVGETV